MNGLMRFVLFQISFIAALATALMTHRWLCRILGIATWPGYLGWVTGQAIVGTGAGLASSFGLYVILGTIPGLPPGPMRITIAIAGSMGIGLLAGIVHAEGHPREDLLEELAAEARLRELLPEALRVEITAALDRVKGRQRALGFMPDDAA